MSLLGLVRHLAEVERATFRLMSGQDLPRLFCSEADRDGDFDGAVPDPQVVAQAWDAWRAEVDRVTRFVAVAPSLDITGDDPLNQHGSGGGPMSLREVLVGTCGPVMIMGMAHRAGYSSRSTSLGTWNEPNSRSIASQSRLVTDSSAESSG
jgi:hypothetical protein